MFKKPLKDVLFVTLQFLLLALFVFDFLKLKMALPVWMQYAGIGVAGMGICILFIAVFGLWGRLSVFPSPVQAGRLQVNGIYKHIRHPMYSGLMFTTLGLALETDSIWRCVICVMLYVLLQFKARYEESLLRDTYSGYAAYMAHTGRFFYRFKN